MIFLALTILVLSLLLITNLIRWKGKGIPGPPSLPLLGNVLQFIGDLPHKKLAKWTEKYGDIFQIRIGRKLNVVISDPAILKQIFKDPTFAGRPVIKFAQLYEERLGFIFNDGPFWETHRRFALKQLKDLGAFPKGMEPSILAQILKVIKIFGESEEPLTSHKIKKIMSQTTAASFWAVICSGHDCSDAANLLEKGMKSLSGIVRGGLLQLVCPWLCSLFPNLGYKLYRDALDGFQAFFESALKERKESFDENNIRDFIDVFLAEMKRAEPGTPFYGDLAEKQLIQSLMELFGGAGDTTATTLEWVMLYLCKNQKVQEKLQEEIEMVTGNTRSVLLADKPKMHFTLAVIEEVLRTSSIIPFGFMHRALQNTNICGYLIQKDTWIMSNLHYIHHNPKIWGDPENFRPERFLDSDGNFKRNENMMAFSTGKRQCVGENIARDSLFLYMTNILQQFSIILNPNQAEPGLEPKMSFLLEPYPFSVVMKQRNN